MYLKELDITGFKSFAKKTSLSFDTPITGIVGPNGSGKSNVAEALRWVLGEQSMKSLRGKRGEDLIWSGSKNILRSNRATITITFDNSKRHFSSVDFDEVSITREVGRDGVNEYRINNSQVRLKDVYELLGEVSLGASSHHIVSQGEADRILNASPKERKEMIEDALGLKIYEYKKLESERKLSQTEENIKEAELLRRELAPHLKFLRKQISEIEKVDQMRQELRTFYQTYFASENFYIKTTTFALKSEKVKLEGELRTINDKKRLLEATMGSEAGSDSTSIERRKKEEELSLLRSKKDECARYLGRLVGMLEVSKGENYVEEQAGVKKCRFCGQRSGAEENAHAEARAKEEEKLKEARGEKESLNTELERLEKEEGEMVRKIADLSRAQDQNSKEQIEAERAVFGLREESNKLENLLTRNKIGEESLRIREEDYKREMGEAAVLVGRDVVDNLETRSPSEVDLDIRKKIERLKIRIEDFGGTGKEIVKEHEETEARDAHLAREIEDLNKSAESLQSLMDDLTKTLDERFKSGLHKINGEFSSFFSLLFGGGEAELKLTKIEKRSSFAKASQDDFLDADLGMGLPSEALAEEGVEISVNLPRKKIRGLEQLSGGERALASIALVFAMSQVNPPPFMVLDETDAALDEANSRKYGDMIEALSKKSQLILVTHNRETMSRANVLYGITMGSDSTSKLLSIKFDDSTAYAK